MVYATSTYTLNRFAAPVGASNVYPLVQQDFAQFQQERNAIKKRLAYLNPFAGIYAPIDLNKRQTSNSPWTFPTEIHKKREQINEINNGTYSFGQVRVELNGIIT